MKTSKKQLKKEAEWMEAYYFTGNVYSYENIVEYINLIARSTAEDQPMNYIKENLESYIHEAFKNCKKEYYNSLKDLIENIKTIKHDNIITRQLYYSAGLYGNSGQLHKIKLYYHEMIVAEYYMYY